MSAESDRLALVCAMAAFAYAYRCEANPLAEAQSPFRDRSTCPEMMDRFHRLGLTVRAAEHHDANRITVAEDWLRGAVADLYEAGRPGRADAIATGAEARANSGKTRPSIWDFLSRRHDETE